MIERLNQSAYATSPGASVLFFFNFRRYFPVLSCNNHFVNPLLIKTLGMKRAKIHFVSRNGHKKLPCIVTFYYILYVMHL